MRSNLESLDGQTAKKAQSLQAMDKTFESNEKFRFGARARSLNPSRNELTEMSQTQKPKQFLNKKKSDQIHVN